MRLSPRQRVEAALFGGRPDQVPFTVYEYKLPQCAVERRLRNDGLCIMNRSYTGYGAVTPNCPTDSFSYRDPASGKSLVRTVVHTPPGDLSSLAEPAEFTSWRLELMFKGPEDYEKLIDPVVADDGELGRLLQRVGAVAGPGVQGAVADPGRLDPLADRHHAPDAAVARIVGEHARGVRQVDEIGPLGTGADHGVVVLDENLAGRGTRDVERLQHSRADRFGDDVVPGHTDPHPFRVAAGPRSSGPGLPGVEAGRRTEC